MEYTNNDRTPYTYLIGWSKNNKWYYGVRYAKWCHPKELWNYYKTSSIYVKFYVKLHGDPDVVSVRKVFSNKLLAVKWEQKVLRRLDVEKDIRFLNKKNSTTSTIIIEKNTSSFKKGHIPWNKGKDISYLFSKEERIKIWGRKKSEEEKIKLKNSMINRYKNSPELKNNLRERTKQQFSDEYKRKKHLEGVLNSNGNHSNTIWINNGYINKRIKKEYIKELNGWNSGRIISDDIKLKMKQGRDKVIIKDVKTGKFKRKGASWE